MANTPYSLGYNIHAKVDYSDIKNANKAAGQFEHTMDSSAKKADKMTDASKKLGGAQKTVADGMKKVSDSAQGLGNRSNQAAGEVGKLHRAITKIKDAPSTAFKAVSDHVKKLGEHSEATRKKLDRLNETGKKWQSTGRSMMPATLAIGAAFAKSAKDATELQHRYTIIKNLVKTGGESTAASVKNTKKMMEQGRQMSLKYGVAQRDIAGGYEELVRRGYDSNQALAAQKTYLQGSIASGDKYSSVVTSAASAIEAFGLKSKNANTMMKNTKMAVNQMAYAADLTATSFSDMGEAMKFAGPDAHSAHQSLGDTAAAIGELSNAHIEGSQAGTSLRQIYQRLINPPSKGKAPNALASIGLKYSDFKDAKGNLLSISDIFQKLNSHMKGMSSTNKGGIYAALFGANASSAANVLGANVKDLKELNQQVAKSQGQNKGKGYVAGLSDKNMKSWQNQFKQFKSAVSDLGMSFARDILPNVTPFVKQLTKLVEGFDKLSPNVKKVVTYGVGFAATAGPLLMAVGSLARGVSAISKGVAFVKPFMTAGGVLSKEYKAAHNSTPVGNTVASVEGQFELSNPAVGQGSLKKEAIVAGKTFNSNATKSLGKTAGTAGKTGGRKFNYQVKSGTLRAGKSGGKKFGSYVRSAGEYAGSNGGGKFSKTVRGLGWGAMGLLAGQGMFTSKTALGRIKAAGQGIGTAIGGYLGGPAGAMIGGVIGDAVVNTVNGLIKANPGARKNARKNVKGQENRTGKNYRTMGANNGIGGYYNDGTGSGVTGTNPDPSLKTGASNSRRFSAAARVFSSHGKRPHKRDVGHGTGKAKIKVVAGLASGGSISGAHTALVGEGGPELAYKVNGHQARLLGANGPQFAKVKPGEHILNARQTHAVISGGGLGHVLPGYATGKGNNAPAKEYGNATAKSKKSLTKFNKDSKKIWSTTQKDTSKTTQGIHKNTVKDFDAMQKSSQTQMNQLHKGVKSAALATAVDFGKAMGRMDNYAHTAMSATIKQLNQGISGINSVLGQFGGNGSVIKPIRYAAGSNGALSQDQIAMVNDATMGPRQELIVRDNQVIAPAGKNRIVPLKKGDQVLNGTQSQKWAQSQGITHFAKGSGVSESVLKKIAAAGAKNPGKTFTNDYSSHINLGGAVLQGAMTGLGKRASNSYGKPWMSAMWKVINDAIGSEMGSGGTREAFLKYAEKNYSGKRYVMGGTGPTVYDCSGMVMSALRHFGINIGRTTEAMQNSSGVQPLGKDLGKTKPGDIVVFGHGTGAAGHVGIIKNPRTGSMFNETPPYARVTSIASDKSMGYGYYRVRGLQDAAKKKQKGSSVRLEKLAKKQLGKKSLSWISSHLGDTLGDMGNANLTGDIGSRARTIAKALKQAYPAARNGGIAGILGNWMQESRLDPNAVNSSDHGSGLGQWTFERETRMRNWTKKHGYAWNSAKGQLEFALHEPGMAAAFKRVLRMSSPTAAAQAFFAGWESGGNMDATGSTRLNNAKNAYAAIAKHKKGGWAQKGKVNVFGEAKGQPEVAINPAQPEADGLIGQTMKARADASPESPSAKFLKSMSNAKVSRTRPTIKPEITININGDISDERMLKKVTDMIETKLTSAFSQINDEFGLDESVY